MNQRIGRFWARNWKFILMLALVSIIAFCWLFPIWFAVTSAFKTEGEIYSGVFGWLPKQWTLRNFEMVLSLTTDASLTLWTWNSVVVAFSHTLLTVVIDSMAAFAFSRLRFKGRDALFSFLLMTMMVPGFINFIPNYLTMCDLDLLDTRLALILPGLSSVFGVFLLRQFFQGLPLAIDESARVDGAGSFTIYARLILPLSVPALIALALITFLNIWNDYLWPLIVVSSSNSRTITLGVSTLFTQYVYQKTAPLRARYSPPLCRRCCSSLASAISSRGCPSRRSRNEGILA